MYDELKEICRACSQGCIYPSECSYFNKPPLRCMRQLLSEAADAIEELQKIANKLLAKYQEEATSVIWEYSGNIDEDIDRLNEEVRTLIAQINGVPLPEPPKEQTE